MTAVDQVDLDFFQLFDAAPVGLAVLDKDLRFLFCNRRLAEMNGLLPEDHLGRSVPEIIPEIDPEVLATLRRAFETGIPKQGIKIAGTSRATGGSRRIWAESIKPLANQNGQIDRVLVSVEDITTLEDVRLNEPERALWTSQQLSLDALTILRAVRDADGQVVDFIWDYANPTAQDLLKGGPLHGKSLLSTLPGNRDHPALFPRYARLLETGDADDVELEYAEDGISGWFRNSAIALDRDRIAVFFRNITQRKQAEHQLRLVRDESRHRIKNILMVVSALVTNSARFSSADPRFAEELVLRLKTMAEAQDLLAKEHRAAIPLEEIIQTALKPFSGPSVRVTPGPPVSVPADTVLPLSLAFSELATNAAKYGSLSTAAGWVDVTWDMADGNVALKWAERAGPPVPPPRGEGFGSRLITHAARSLNNGRAERTFAPDGLRVLFSFTPEPSENL